MKIEEHCPCGGTIEIHFDSGPARSYRSHDQADKEEARKQYDNWRRRHKDCLKRNDSITFPLAAAPTTTPLPSVGPSPNQC